MKTDYYKFIPEWNHNCDFPLNVYSKAAEDCRNGDILCEVNNAFFGKHACYMMELLAEKNKKAKFYVFDMFNMVDCYLDGDKLDGVTPWNENVDSWLARIGGRERSLDIFDFYIKNCPYSHKLTNRAQYNSWHVAHEFKNESVFFVFIRLTTSPVHTKNCLDCWYPKIRNGGSIVLYQTDIKIESKYAVERFILDHNLNSLTSRYSNHIIIGK